MNKIKDCLEFERNPNRFVNATAGAAATLLSRREEK